MLSKTLSSFVGYRFSTGTVAGDDYKLFQSRMRSDLRKQARQNGMELYSFSKNHYEFSAVLQNKENGRFVYISISDVRFWQDEWTRDTLVRSMKHDRDWTGGRNQRSAWENVGAKAKEISMDDREYI